MDPPGAVLYTQLHRSLQMQCMVDELNCGKDHRQPDNAVPQEIQHLTK